MDIIEIEEANEKTAICESLLKKLPNWFGNPTALMEYAAGCAQYFFYAAYDNTTPVGFVSVKIHNTSTAEIYVMGILESYHRRGLGRKFITLAEQLCQNHGLEFLTVKTLDESVKEPYYARTRQFYSAVGFKPLEVFTELWGPAAPCLFMAKHLSS